MKTKIKNTLQAILTLSLKHAARSQGLERVKKELTRLVPDISQQYSSFNLNNDYLVNKARNMHAFQISLLDKVIGEFKKVVIVDIGDSSGTHLKYIMGLYSRDRDIRCLSVNLDAVAVEKIKNSGFEAVNARAEELGRYNINADIFLCFEILEHMTDPCRFLHELSTKTKAKYLIASVPYLRRSRVGLHHIRRRDGAGVTAESTHIFELSPKDWKLLIRHGGWDIINDHVYFQYPKNNPLWFTKPLWERYDFEGFYGLILKKDDSWSSRYKDW